MCVCVHGRVWTRRLHAVDTLFILVFDIAASPSQFACLLGLINFRWPWFAKHRNGVIQIAQAHKTFDPFSLCMHDLFQWILISVRLICCYCFIIWIIWWWWWTRCVRWSVSPTLLCVCIEVDSRHHWNIDSKQLHVILHRFSFHEWLIILLLTPN